MSLNKFKTFFLILSFLFLAANVAFTQMLDLGSEEVKGKKDQPEAITFISRTRLEFYERPVNKLNGYDLIKNEIQNGIFDVEYKRYQ